MIVKWWSLLTTAQTFFEEASITQLDMFASGAHDRNRTNSQGQKASESVSPDPPPHRRVSVALQEPFPATGSGVLTLLLHPPTSIGFPRSRGLTAMLAKNLPQRVQARTGFQARKGRNVLYPFSPNRAGRAAAGVVSLQFLLQAALLVFLTATAGTRIIPRKFSAIKCYFAETLLTQLFHFVGQ